jgi:adenosylcobinamide kinase/adenosylcobinamide-phosphate guanylyltransferase
MSSLLKPQPILVTGGARSGKSRFAEQLAGKPGGPVIYLATAQALDAEMAERIARHRRRRPAEWATIEEPLGIAGVIRARRAGEIILCDCLTLYLSNLFLQKYDGIHGATLEDALQKELDDLVAAIKESPAQLIIVTNETGWGIVPENEAARHFRDWAGLYNQAVAAVCGRVYLVACGIPLLLKGEADV